MRINFFNEGEYYVENRRSVLNNKLENQPKWGKQKSPLFVLMLIHVHEDTELVPLNFAH